MANGLLQTYGYGEKPGQELTFTGADITGMPISLPPPVSQPTMPIEQVSGQSPSLGSRAMGILGSIGGALGDIGGAAGRGLVNLGGGVQQFFQDRPDLLDTLSIGFGGMSMRPNEGLIDLAKARIAQREFDRQEKATANRTVEYFRSMGRNDLAQLIEANPGMATNILESVIGVGSEKFALRGFAPDVDPETGQKYAIRFNPNTGEFERVNIPGTFGETPEQEFQRQTEQNQINIAREKGIDVFNKIQEIDKQATVYDQMIEQLDAGAETGYIRNFFPAMNAETSQLRSLANDLGLGVVSSVTFGALSASELSLALSTAIDTNVSPEELRRQIAAKQAAQAKLRAFLADQAQTLTSGIGYDEYINDYLRKTAEAERQGLLDNLEGSNVNLLPGVTGVRIIEDG